MASQASPPYSREFTEDRVVRELDVWLCRGALASDSQTWVLQSPLRSSERPYQGDDGFGSLHLRPASRRLHASIPLDARSSEFDSEGSDFRNLHDLDLRSAPCNHEVGLCAGFVENDNLFLLPVDHVCSLRPSMAHLDERTPGGESGSRATQARGLPDIKEEGMPSPPPPNMTPVTVHIRRRETEQQMEARLRSFAHLAQLEEAEPWIPLACHGRYSELTEQTFAALAAYPQGARPLARAMDREAYAAAVVPVHQAEGEEATEMAVGGAALADDGLGGRRSASAGPGSTQDARSASRQGSATAAAQQQQLPEALREQVVEAAELVFKHVPVLTSHKLREHLERTLSGEAAAAVAAAPEASLRAALLGSERVVRVQDRLVYKHTGNQQGDALRAIVLSILKDRPSFRKTEVAALAKEEGVQFTDGLLSKAIKDLCVSRGSLWALKG